MKKSKRYVIISVYRFLHKKERIKMSKIPELMTTISGEKITTVEEWETFRRGEIMTLLSNYIYGVRTVERPNDLHFVVEKEEKSYLGADLDYKKINICFSDYSFPVHGYYPKNTQKKVGAFLYVMHEAQLNKFDFEKDLKSENIDTEKITQKGYAVFIMPTIDLYPDWEHKCNHQAGIFKVFGPDEKARQDNSWATISAWSWGLSRIFDYLETDDAIDTTKVFSIGHSRCGKTALWAAATDTRFACAFSNNSGCGGAAMHRTKIDEGEHIKDINITDWFCDNYRKFNDREDFLPVDQHMLIASLAPRLCYVTSSSLDDWADPAAERLSCRMAGEAYELYGKKGVVLPDEPVEVDTPYHEGSIGYHVKTGKHSLLEYDWDLFFDFLDKKLN